jgi:hypothetical protein
MGGVTDAHVMPDVPAPVPAAGTPTRLAYAFDCVLMSSPPTLTPLAPGRWQLVHLAPMMLAYTFVNVGLSVSQVTSTDCDDVVVHTGALGETVSVIVTVSGVDGQVNVGDALEGLSNVPAVAVQANVGVTDPAEAVAERAMGLSTVVSSGKTEIELMFAQSCVEPLTTIVPASAVAPLQTSVRLTPVVVRGTTLKLADPAQVMVPSTEVAASVIV